MTDEEWARWVKLAAYTLAVDAKEKDAKGESIEDHEIEIGDKEVHIIVTVYDKFP